MSTLFEYYSSGDDSTVGFSSTTWEGQTFTPQTTHKITNAKLKLFRYNTPSTLTIGIKDTVSGLPYSSTDLCYGTISGDTLTSVSTGAWYNVDFGAGYRLIASTEYAIVARAPTSTGDNFVYWRVDITSPTYNRGAFCYSSNSGLAWVKDASYDYMFEEYGDVLTASTSSATSITTSTAIFNGNIPTEAGENADYRGFVWDTVSQATPGNTTPSSTTYDYFETVSGSFASGAFTASIAGLSPITTYYNRAFAHDSSGWVYGNEVNFDTIPENFPSIGSLQTRIAFVNTPFETSPTWVNVANNVREIHTKRGRNHELDRMESGTLDIVFNNEDGDLWPDNTNLVGWSKRIKLTIDHTKITSTLTQFPIMIKLGASSGISSKDTTTVFNELGANSLKIALVQENGTQLYVEIEKWDNTGEEAILWASLSGWTLSSIHDTVLYLYYDSTHADNSTYVGVQGSRTEVWDSNYQIVDHLCDNPDTSHTMDSTSNNNDGTKIGANTPIEANGKIGKGQESNGVDNCINFVDAVSIQNIFDGGGTAEALIYPHSDGEGDLGIFLIKGTWWCRTREESGGFVKLEFMHTFTSGNSAWRTTTAICPINTWSHIAILYDADSDVNDPIFYLNGTILSVTEAVVPSGTRSTDVGNVLSLCDNGATSNRCYDGLIDEARLSNIARSAAWLLATKHNYWDNLITYSTGYNPNVDVMKKINIRAYYNGWHDIFTGYVESYKPSYLGKSGYGSLMTLHCVGAIGKVLSLQVINSASGYPQASSGARVNNVLTDCGIPSGWIVADGGDELICSTGAITNLNALSHLQTVQETELSLLYESPSGNLIYESRGHRIEGSHASSQATFGTASDEVGYADFKYVKDEFLLFNEARITRTGGSEQISTASASQVKYGKRSYVKSGLLHTNDISANVEGDFIVSRYSTPIGRVASITIIPDSSTKWTQIFTREISDRITIRNPNAGIDTDYFIESIQHDWDFVSKNFSTQYQLSHATQYFNPIEAKIQILRPNASGDSTLLSSNGGANYGQVDEVSQDGDATIVYNSTPAASSFDLYNIQNPDYAQGTINYITLTGYFKRFPSADGIFEPSIKTNGTVFGGVSASFSSNWTSYTWSYTQNPITSADWTWADINNLQIGEKLVGTNTHWVACTQVYTTINFTPNW